MPEVEPTLTMLPELLQKPPDVASDSVVVPPTHTPAAPVMGATELTLIVRVTTQLPIE